MVKFIRFIESLKRNFNLANFKLLDKFTFVYIFFNILIIIFGWNYVKEPAKNLIIFLSFFLILFLSRKYQNKTGLLKFIADLHPYLFFAYFFETISSMNLVFFHNYIDPFFQKIDKFIFGYQPTIKWGRALDNYFWQEWFHFAYFSYYPMIVGVGLWLYIKRKEDFFRFTFLVYFLFYLCYVTYIFLPVIGGRFYDINMEITKEYRYGVFTRIMAFIYRNSPHKGGAFPSSHVAVALMVSLYAYKIKRKLGSILIFITFSLAIATIYCHYHYFIDTIFGIFYSILAYYFGLKIYRRYA